MKSGRIDVGSIRREQIIDAATAIIAEHGIQNLSLSAIEAKAGMSRGQLTYYFKAKEQILLAVFDRMVRQMRERAITAQTEAAQQGSPPQTLECFEHVLEMLLLQPPVSPEFFAVQYTFLSQITHRPDFRARLATLYEEWRTHMAEGMARDLKENGQRAPASPRAVACVIQALLHGLAVQMAADPNALPRQEVHDLCLDLVSEYLKLRPRQTATNGRKKTTRKRKPTAGNKHG